MCSHEVYAFGYILITGLEGIILSTYSYCFSSTYSYCFSSLSCHFPYCLLCSMQNWAKRYWTTTKKSKQQSNCLLKIWKTKSKATTRRKLLSFKKPFTIMCCSGTMRAQTEKDVAYPSFTLNYSVEKKKS